MGDDSSSQETQVPNGKRNHLLYRTALRRADFFVLKKGNADNNNQYPYLRITK